MKQPPQPDKGTTRQPVLKLPHVMPNGARTNAHPFLWLLKQHMQQYPDTFNKSELARRLAIRPQSLYKWERACRNNRNFPLPVLRAKQLGDFFKVSPATFRPDFPWSTPA